MTATEPSPEYVDRIPHRQEGDYTPAERLGVFYAALALVPRGSKPRGVPGLITGETIPGAPSVDAALRVARFALDPEQEIPGVDRPWHQQEVAES